MCCFRAFAATAATIVSGSVAERIKVSAYFAYSIVITAFVYPVVVHWVWDSAGWLNIQNPILSGSHGLIDFAGSSVVHMVGGFSGLCGAIAAKPRIGRFTEAFDQDGRPVVVSEHNKLLAALGVLILWVGWYGFNCGSTLAVTGGASILAGKVAVTTSLAASAGMITCMTYSRVFHGHYSLLHSLNGVLAGLVSITAGTATVEPYSAIAIGVIGGLVYMGASAMLLKLKIDDPLEAAPIHGFCGAWAILAVGIFSTADGIKLGYGLDEPNAVSSGAQFATQLIGALAVFAWTMTTSGLTFFVIAKTSGVRVDQKIELLGLDTSEHGGSAYTARHNVTYPSSDKPKLAPTKEEPNNHVAVDVADKDEAAALIPAALADGEKAL